MPLLRMVLKNIVSILTQYKALFINVIMIPVSNWEFSVSILTQYKALFIGISADAYADGEAWVSILTQYKALFINKRR